MESKIYPNVVLGKDVSIGDYCEIGVPPVGAAPGELETIIGDGAVIRSHTVIYAGNRIGARFMTGHHVCIRESNVIGDDVSIGTLSCIEHHIRIGDGVRIHSQVFVPEYTELESGAWIGPQTVFTNARYPKSKGVKEHLAGVRVGRDAKIGANCTLLPGVVIGDEALVGAGSVVVRNVGKGVVCSGNPARKTGLVKDIPEYGKE